MRDAGYGGPDVGSRGLSVGPGNCEKRPVPSAVGAGFFVAEDEVVEEGRRVRLFAIIFGKTGIVVGLVALLFSFLSSYPGLVVRVVALLFSFLSSYPGLVIRDALINRRPDMDLPGLSARQRRTRNGREHTTQDVVPNSLASQ